MYRLKMESKFEVGTLVKVAISNTKSLKGVVTLDDYGDQYFVELEDGHGGWYYDTELELA